MRGRAVIRPVATPYLLLLPGALVIVVLCGALAITVATSLHDGKGNLGLWQYKHFFSDSFYLGFLWRSIIMAAYCTPLTLLLGYPYAYVMARSAPTARLALTLILVVQLFTGSVVQTFSLVVVLGNNGILNRVLLALGIIGTPVRLLFHEPGVAIGLILIPLPFMVFPIYSVLKNIDPHLETAATSLGANRARTFLHITIPLSAPGIMAGIVLVFLLDLTAYIIPGMLGGGFVKMIANVIEEQAMAVLDQRFAAAMSISLLLITFGILYLIQAVGSRDRGVTR